MADDGIVQSAPTDTAALPLVVVVAGEPMPAVTIAEALYVPVIGADVVTVPLSDGSVLVLGPRTS